MTSISHHEVKKQKVFSSMLIFSFLSDDHSDAEDDDGDSGYEGSDIVDRDTGDSGYGSGNSSDYSTGEDDDDGEDIVFINEDNDRPPPAFYPVNCTKSSPVYMLREQQCV